MWNMRHVLLVVGLLMSMSFYPIDADDGAEPSPVKFDEQLVFFPTAAHFDETAQEWTLPIHGWIFEPEDALHRKYFVALILKKKYGLEFTDATTRRNFNERVGWFCVDNERGKRVGIRLAGRDVILPASAANGHFSHEIRLPARVIARYARKGSVHYTALDVAGDRHFQGTVLLVPPSGISVISDIDDTIKISHVTQHAKLFQHTFYLDFEAVAGIAARYARWARQGVAFHFVSSSPWQLYRSLQKFMTHNGFPRGTFHLKYIRLTDSTFFNLFKKGIDTKPRQIEPILQAFPRRRFILIGDSGEQDPEIYAQLMRQYPQQILKIWIRNVTRAERQDPRFQKTFAALDPTRWELFTRAADLKIDLPGD